MRKRNVKLLAWMLTAAVCACSMSTTSYAYEEITVSENGIRDEETEAEAIESEEIYDEYAELDGYMEVPFEDEIYTDTDTSTRSRVRMLGATMPSAYPANDDFPKIKLPNYVFSLPLRNQKGYNTCWAFSSLAMAEISMGKKGLTEPASTDYSELALAYFSYNPVVDPLGGTDGDINSVTKTDYLNAGGNYLFSKNILAAWVGATEESKARYDDAAIVVVSENGLDSNLAYDDVAHLRNFYSVSMSSTNSVKSLIKDYGSVGVSMYSSRIYYNSTYNTYLTKTIYDDKGKPHKNANHAITIIGWNDNIPASYFTTGDDTPSQNGAWLCRNSYYTSKKAEYQGYFWMSYEDPNLGNTAFCFEFADTSEYDNNYQYDGGMYGASYTVSGQKQILAANVFTAHSGSEAELLKAVSFNTSVSGTRYTIDVYKNPTDETDPTSGELIEEATVSGKVTYSGQNTITLNSLVPLKSGDRYAVVVSLANNSTDTRIEYEVEASGSWYYTKPSAQAGQSFVYDYATESWTDFGLANNANLRIKAFTSNTNLGYISYESNGGENAPENPDYYIVGDPIEFSPAEKPGFSFDGWFLDEACTISIADTTSLTGEDITLYAKWIPLYTTDIPQIRVTYQGEKVELITDGETPDSYTASTHNGTKLYASTVVASAHVFYTIDGVDPNPMILSENTLEGTKTYTGPLTISGNPGEKIIVKLLATQENHGNSPVVTCTFSIIDDSANMGDLDNNPTDKADLANQLGKTVAELTPADIPTGLWVCGIETEGYVYTGKGITIPDLHVYFGNKILALGTEYSVKYQRNVNAYTLSEGETGFLAKNAPTVIITGKGNYQDNYSRNFKINKQDISGREIPDIFVKSNNKIQKGSPTVGLKKNKDYYLQYEGTDFDLTTANKARETEEGFVPFKSPGDYEIRIIGNGNYTGSVTVVEHIKDASLYTLVSALKITVPSVKYSYSEGDRASYAEGNWDGIVPAYETVTVKNGRNPLTGFYAAGAKSSTDALALYVASGRSDCSFVYFCTNNTDVGTAHITFVGIEGAGFVGSVTRNYKITGTAISKTKVTYDNTARVYTGEAFDPGISAVTYQDKTMAEPYPLHGMSLEDYQALVESESSADKAACQMVEYTYYCTKNIAKGTATVVISGCHGYTGTIKKTFRINATDSTALVSANSDTSHIVISQNSTGTPWNEDDIKTETYTKGGCKPAITVTYTRCYKDASDQNTSEIIQLKEGTDYTLTYKNCGSVNDGLGKYKPYVVIKFKGNFAGSVTRYYTIAPADLGSQVSMSATDIANKAKGNICSPSIVLTDMNGKKLTAGTDYNKMSVVAGSYTYLEDSYIDRLENKQLVRYKVKSGDMVQKTDVIPVGTRIVATATAKAVKCNYAGSVSTRFTFVKGLIGTTSAGIPTQDYTGKAVEPGASDITVTTGTGKNKVTLVAGVDYEIVPGSYSNNINRGTASLTIRGLGNYGGTKLVKYSIRRWSFLWF